MFFVVEYCAIYTKTSKCILHPRDRGQAPRPAAWVCSSVSYHHVTGKSGNISRFLVGKMETMVFILKGCHKN